MDVAWFVEATVTSPQSQDSEAAVKKKKNHIESIHSNQTHG